VTESICSLGSNVGDRLRGIVTAAELISVKAGDVVGKSAVYETPPWGLESQPKFLNACILINTDLTPRELLRALKGIESGMGRVPRERWGPREIDIDIVTYGDGSYEDDALVIPHPRMSERAFVLMPMRDIAPSWRHPASGLSVEDMLSRVDTGGIVRITQL
jgi:2-amino-4-hydroxy-6-hydroxymethyldihydropteridine diphosphokinase